MDDLTLEEKTSFARRRAAEEVAEKHFYDKAQPFYPSGFQIYKRNKNHWDVAARQCPGKVTAWLTANPGSSTTAKDGESERAFRIRGEPGNVVVLDERWNPHNPHPRGALIFRSITAAMVYISEELMQEPTPHD